ncbi:RNase adapter RapZ [Simiduia sp. 21SJ11W-1]|uniref:RNase adapter RapZ n=1 Tax=Simiduia sp. 21SJ11W-1 TaxID=2909669 RepID=UPI00209C841A|nr:RNase adapter RapZ [Simiduia sp. 21SJ11W-1]UTA48815.1 RNase adapter RapZ [Simiduia sp. 21SJ11W-1]
MPTEPSTPRLIVVSGRSGAGKSTALHVLEDLGFNCIDNLPLRLLPELVKQLEADPTDQQSFAISVDARNAWRELTKFPQIIAHARDSGIHIEVMFLDARSPALIQRFSENRRKHPLSRDGVALRDALIKERELLQPVVDLADLVIDSTNLTLHQLRDLVKVRVRQSDETTMALQLMSFGFKRGVPVDADFVFDVRCLPNPYWKPELRAQTGQDQGVADFLEAQEDTSLMLDDIYQHIHKWLPRFEASNRSYMTVSIGCTGGQHRSVYIAEQLHKKLMADYPKAQLRHRELVANHGH